jgi:uncharacterized protein (TIGR03437 family)
MRDLLLLSLGLLIVQAGLPLDAAKPREATDVPAPVNVLTANYNNERTNANLKEVILNPSNVSKDTFGKIGSFPVDGQIYAQPLYATGIQIPGKGLRNVVYTVTMHNSVYAIDADAPGSMVPLWQVNLGRSIPSSVFNFTDILPETGILSTPVIDLGRQAIYVMSDTLEAGVPVFRLHALSLADGHEMLNGPVQIAAAVPGMGIGSDNGMLPFAASEQLQRPGLALANGNVYAGFGSHGDDGNYHGWMIAYDASDLRRRVAVFNAAPDTYGGSIWQAGRAPAIDSAGNIYASTGNGGYPDTPEFADSLVKLSGKDLAVLDWYTPDNWLDLADGDADLGAAGAILIPGANRALVAGKSGSMWMVDSTAMGHVGTVDSPNAQTILASPGGVYSYALWNRPDGPMVYVHNPWGALQTYKITNGVLDATVLSQSIPTTASLYTGVAVSADDSSDGTAIVWETTGDYNATRVPGTLHAFDATDLTHELWNSDMLPNRDTLGRFAKFVAPTVVNGRVYVPTFSGQLAIYGLLSSAGQGGNNLEVQVTAVASGASLIVDAVSPGEVVTISGANMGPVLPSNLWSDPSQAATVMADTTVLFDGVPAPLVYTSWGEVSALVPFGVAGPTTQVQVTYRGQSSAPITVPVVAAAPALFAEDGTGGGTGAIVNADGSPNWAFNPANRGSIVALYGTGLGQTTPPGEDGKIAGDLPLPTPVLPVTVLLDDQAAEVLYAGVAPGMMQGYAQVNVRIPLTLAPSYSVRVTLKVGDYTSPSIIFLSVQ